MPRAFWTGARTARRVRFSLAVSHCGQESENSHALQVSMSFVGTQSIAGHFPVSTWIFHNQLVVLAGIAMGGDLAYRAALG